MKFPREVFIGYKAIQSCSLVRNKDTKPEALKEFENLLNSAQPQSGCSWLERYETIKDIYIAKKNYYSNFIKGTSLECTILWTESKLIVSWFGLGGIVHISYDTTARRYVVKLHRNLENNNSSKDLNIGVDKFFNTWNALPRDDETPEHQQWRNRNRGVNSKSSSAAQSAPAPAPAREPEPTACDNFINNDEADVEDNFEF